MVAVHRAGAASLCPRAVPLREERQLDPCWGGVRLGERPPGAHEFCSWRTMTLPRRVARSGFASSPSRATGRACYRVNCSVIGCPAPRRTLWECSPASTGGRQSAKA